MTTIIRGVKRTVRQNQQGPRGVAGLNWIEAGWSVGLVAAEHDALLHNGTSYRCTAAHTAAAGTEPGIGASWATVWEVVASKGDSGTAGAQGSAGPAGVVWIDAGWSSGQNYAAGAGLFRGDSSFRCAVAHTSSAATEPGVGVDWQTVWVYLAKGIATADSGVLWSLKNTGVVAPVSVPTYSGPSVFWAPDSDGIYRNMGALVNALGQRIPPVSGCRMVGDVAMATSVLGAPLTGLQMVLQPAVTNKVTCRKRNPIDTTNITKGGDAAATLAVVDDTAAILAAGLQHICSTGKVYELVVPAGAVASYATLLGSTINTNIHSLSVWARVVSGNPAQMTLGNTLSQPIAITGSSYQRFSGVQTPSANTGMAVLVINVPCTVRFILPSLTETMTPTAYPMVDLTDGLNAVTYTATDLSYPNPLPGNNWQWRTKIKVDGTPATDMWLWGDGTAGVYYKAADSKIYYKHGSGTEIATAAVSAGNTYDLGVRQSSVSGASISMNQTVTTNAALTANHTPGATLYFGEKGDNTLYFRGRLQQQTNGDFFAFANLLNQDWYKEDI